MKKTGTFPDTLSGVVPITARPDERLSGEGFLELGQQALPQFMTILPAMLWPRRVLYIRRSLHMP